MYAGGHGRKTIDGVFLLKAMQKQVAERNNLTPKFSALEVALKVALGEEDTNSNSVTGQYYYCVRGRL